MWKARFPILKSLRTAFPLSQKIVLATAVLFNIARMWEDEEIDDDEDSVEEEDQDGGGGDHVVVHDEATATLRLRGQLLREKLKDEMPPR